MTRQTHDLILHIGHYKTGTTALQVFLQQNRTALARQGLVYAATALDHAKHSALAFALLRDAGVSTLLYGFNDPRSAAARWRDLFDEARSLPKGAALVVSSEEFMRLGAHPRAADILRRILARAPDIRLRVIAYLRPPQAHLRSWYNQMIKLGHPVAGFDAAVTGQFEPVHRDYALALAPWIDLCGADGVILRGFGNELRKGDALYRDFLGALGGRMPRRAILPGSDPNPRLDDRLLPLLRVLNDSDLPRPTAERILHHATEALRSLDGPELRDSFASIHATAQAGIAELAALPGAGFDPKPLLADLPRPEDGGNATLDALTAVLTHELVQMRAAQRRIQMRLVAVEQHLGLTPGRDDA